MSCLVTSVLKQYEKEQIRRKQWKEGMRQVKEQGQERKGGKGRE